MEEEGENDEVDEGEELMPGVVLKRFATPETSATTVCPEFRQWAQCAVAGYTAASGELFAPRRSQWARVGDGDVCRNIVIPMYMIFPRLFTCPTMKTKTFTVEFEVNLVILFSDGHLLTENFPLRLVRTTAVGFSAMRPSRAATSFRSFLTI